MSITSYELVQVVQDNVTADLVVWARYRRPAFGIVEAMLDYNPQLAVIHQTTPFIPPGTYVMIPIDPAILASVAANSNPNNNNMWRGGGG